MDKRTRSYTTEHVAKESITEGYVTTGKEADRCEGMIVEKGKWVVTEYKPKTNSA